MIIIVGFIIVHTFRTKKLNYKFIYKKFQNSISRNTVVFAFMPCRYTKKGYLFALKPFKITQRVCGRPSEENKCLCRIFK